MITRIVKMQFKKDAIEYFKEFFKKTQPGILAFEGCISVQLLQDISDATILMTISKWKDVESLEQYRGSEFFRTTWKTTKTFFTDKAQAWSLKTIE